MTSFFDVDWSSLPVLADDGAAAHLAGQQVASVRLASTSGGTVDLTAVDGCCVVYAYPMTGRPDRPLPDGWDSFPGARGCTPQSCAFRDHAAELRALGVDRIFGLSTQDTAYQQEAVGRLHLPFPLLSDLGLDFARAMRLPTFAVEGMTLLKRLTLIARDGVVQKVFYPVFPPDRNVVDVLDWLRRSSER